MNIGDWVVQSESATYWNVGEFVGYQGTEEAYSPVCRVKKHSLGREHLDKILAASDWCKIERENAALRREVNGLRAQLGMGRKYVECNENNIPQRSF